MIVLFTAWHKEKSRLARGMDKSRCMQVHPSHLAPRDEQSGGEQQRAEGGGRAGARRDAQVEGEEERDARTDGHLRDHDAPVIRRSRGGEIVEPSAEQRARRGADVEERAHQRGERV